MLLYEPLSNLAGHALIRDSFKVLDLYVGRRIFNLLRITNSCDVRLCCLTLSRQNPFVTATVIDWSLTIIVQYIPTALCGPAFSANLIRTFDLRLLDHRFDFRFVCCLIVCEHPSLLASSFQTQTKSYTTSSM